MRIAIVEPEPIAADLLMFVAQRRGHQPVCVPEVGRLFGRLPFEPSAAVISVHGEAVEALHAIARLKEAFAALPILVIAEKGSGIQPIDALRAGANDVIKSPYNPFEVMLRAEAWVSAGKTNGSSGVRLGDLEVDLGVFAATKNGHRLALTRLERRLLYCLCEHYPNVATIERLLVFGWESLDDPDAALLKTHISHIRKKLREAGGLPIEIASQQTIGYSLRIDEARSMAS